MAYRVEIKSGKRWRAEGLDCLTIEEVRDTLRTLARDVVYRVRMVDA